MKAKKALGQNWLVDQKALGEIIAAAELTENDNVLEIGPGTGVLSAELMKYAGKVMMIEKDEELVHQLRVESKPTSPELRRSRKLELIEGDVLAVNLPKLLEENNFTDYKLVANIPYYITGKLLRLIFETKHQPKLIVLLVQKEVAERVCANPSEIVGSRERSVDNGNSKNEKSIGKKKISRGKPGRMSKLSVMVQLNGQPEIVDYVPKESFRPMPKVDSAILRIRPFGKEGKARSGDFKEDADGLKTSLAPSLPKEEKEWILRLVRIGFASRRKTLVNNLVAGLRLEKKVAEEALAKIGQNPKVRPQDLSVEDWGKLSELLIEK